MNKQNIKYLLDTSTDATVYLERPIFRKPKKRKKKKIKGKKGKSYRRPKATNGVKPIKVRDIFNYGGQFQEVEFRDVERGLLINHFYARRIFALTRTAKIMEEWLLVRRQEDGGITHSFSNAPADTTLEELALLKCRRLFVEQTFRDCKTELGWDEFQALKYNAWMHHTALTALALWFITSIKLDWSRLHPADPELARELEFNMLPHLSVSNVREIFKVGFEKPRLTSQDVEQVVMQHLLNRSRSTKSKLKGRKKKNHVNSS